MEKIELFKSNDKTKMVLSPKIEDVLLESKGLKGKLRPILSFDAGICNKKLKGITVHFLEASDEYSFISFKLTKGQYSLINKKIKKIEDQEGLPKTTFITTDASVGIKENKDREKSRRYEYDEKGRLIKLTDYYFIPKVRDTVYKYHFENGDGLKEIYKIDGEKLISLEKIKPIYKGTFKEKYHFIYSQEGLLDKIQMNRSKRYLKVINKLSTKKIQFDTSSSSVRGDLEIIYENKTFVPHAQVMKEIINAKEHMCFLYGKHSSLNNPQITATFYPNHQVKSVMTYKKTPDWNDVELLASDTPEWLQHDATPKDPDGNPMQFIAQLEASYIWGTYYLFYSQKHQLVTQVLQFT